MRLSSYFMVLAAAGFALPAGAVLQARDFNHDGRVDAYYDTDHHLTWLADANAAAGTVWDNGSSNTDGLMTLSAANAWAANLNVAGVSGWRLPTLVDLGTPGCNAGFSGTDCGYNVDTTDGEMAAIFHLVLGNLAAYDTAGLARPGVSGVDWGLVHTGPFSGLQNDAYWLGTPYPSHGSPSGWSFFTTSGRQIPFSAAAEMHGWAVFSGDAAPVPEPATTLLMLGGAAALLGKRRSRT
jgi:hypothetical protein